MTENSALEVGKRIATLEAMDCHFEMKADPGTQTPLGIRGELTLPDCAE